MTTHPKQTSVWRGAVIAGFALALLAIGPRTGAADMCGPTDLSGAIFMDQTVEDTCCADVDGSGKLYLAQCTRQAMYVYRDGGWNFDYGPGYDCHNVGTPCN